MQCRPSNSVRHDNGMWGVTDGMLSGQGVVAQQVFKLLIGNLYVLKL